MTCKRLRSSQSDTPVLTIRLSYRFCPGTAMLGDGRIMVTGGANNHAVSIYNPADNSWLKGKSHCRRRDDRVP